MAFCTSCGSEIEQGTTFCTQCGASVTGDAAASPQAAETVVMNSVPQNTTNQQAAPYGSSSVTQQMPMQYVADNPVGVAPNNQGGKKKTVLIAIIIVAVIAIAAVAVFFVLKFTSSPSSSSTPTQTPAKVQPEGNSSSATTQQQESSDTSTSQTTTESQDYILPGSDSQYLSESDLSTLTDWELYLARNEIFARHGRGFKNADLVDWFSQKSWYTQLYTPEQFDSMESPLNDYEKKNCELIHNIEEKRGSSYLS